MTPTFEIDPNVFEQNREYDGDSKLFAVFYQDTELDDQQSQEMGRPVHRNVDLVKIIVPGQKDSVVAKATFEYQQRFPKQWAQYKQREEQVGTGTPLSELSFLTRAQVADLKAINVHTAEQLAGMNDSNSHSLMGFHSIKERARNYIENAAGQAPLLKLQAQIDELAAKNEELTSLINQQREAAQAAKTTVAAPKAVAKA
jgi:hypothetical protein